MLANFSQLLNIECIMWYPLFFPVLTPILTIFSELLAFLCLHRVAQLSQIFIDAELLATAKQYRTRHICCLSHFMQNLLQLSEGARRVDNTIREAMPDRLLLLQSSQPQLIRRGEGRGEHAEGLAGARRGLKRCVLAAQDGVDHGPDEVNLTRIRLVRVVHGELLPVGDGDLHQLARPIVVRYFLVRKTHTSLGLSFALLPDDDLALRWVVMLYADYEAGLVR